MTKNFVVSLGLVLLLGAASVFAVELTDEEADQCRENGGCLLVTAAALRAKLAEVFERGHEAGRISCGNRT